MTNEAVEIGEIEFAECFRLPMDRDRVALLDSSTD